ncbi:hypothetical protein CVT24_001507 [Panaeolus cyanescens]|uniref:Uncharacterized protein n=1 Tax=Panaeolus cyanescens TaxID=181874 RepID=A0A409YFA5_9AGAR|nr:hypothetical protein CVT24_001507 [Panaeolus cyanescens]
MFSGLFGLGVGSAQGVLVLRTIALYDHDKNLKSYICVFLALVYTPVTIILVFWANTAEFGPPPPGVVGCHINAKNYILFTAYIALALTETILVILTVRQVLKKFGGLGRVEDDNRHSLIRTLNRDGVLFFICLFLLSVCNMMISFHGPYTDLLSTLQRIMHGTLTSRMVLHLREAAAHPSGTLASVGSGDGPIPMHSSHVRRTRVSSIRFERFASPIDAEGSAGAGAGAHDSKRREGGLVHVDVR